MEHHDGRKTMFCGILQGTTGLKVVISIWALYKLSWTSPANPLETQEARVTAGELGLRVSQRSL